MMNRLAVISAFLCIICPAISALASDPPESEQFRMPDNKGLIDIWDGTAHLRHAVTL